MFKIEIKAESGINVKGWLKSDFGLWYLDEYGEPQKWHFAEGDKLAIIQDADSADVPRVINEAVNFHKI